MVEAKTLDLDQLETEIRGIVQNNDKLITQIEELKNNKKILSKTFHELKVTTPKFPNIREAYEFSCEDSIQEQSFEDLLISWRVPPGLDNLEDPDPDKLLYGENKELMNVKCETYEDLQRINKQIYVALKYVTLLRESASINFGKKFKKNFEYVNTLLKQILEIYEPKQGEDIIGNQIHGAVKDLNLQMMKLFQSDSVVNALPGKLSISSKILTKEMERNLYLMLPRKKEIWKFKLIHDSSQGITTTHFDQVVKGLSPTLIIIRSTSNYVFGAYIEDVWGSPGGWIKGSEQNFLFTFGSLDAIKPIKLNHNGIGNGIHISSCGLHLGSDLIAFCSHSCTPSVYTKIAPGYPNVTINDRLLAGANAWTPSLMEVFKVDK